MLIMLTRQILYCNKVLVKILKLNDTVVMATMANLWYRYDDITCYINKNKKTNIL